MQQITLDTTNLQPLEEKKQKQPRQERRGVWGGGGRGAPASSLDSVKKILQVCSIFEDKRQTVIGLCQNFLGIHGKFVNKQEIII